MVPSDFDWDKLSKSDLHSLSDHFGAAKSPGGFELTFVPTGETIIAEVYEAMPGEFVCTKLIPTIEKRGDGEEVVVFKVDCQALTLDGNVNTRFYGFENTREVEPGNSLSMVELASDGQYEMHFWVEPRSRDQLLKAHVKGRFQKKPTQPQKAELPD
ncbi:MAG: hypothetical protein IAE77_09335 [Prosthecobacter sp.]|uniref:hypothetical protein n=1 Tax=Prosthecobacter sp. TaxID=1965333 RepID=UPI0019F28FEF|nr:hypothetical protein [Prosthecobacter sp.]MBE2283643.1 hypothetical protein [Prosthecobacter sp.]